jgi:glutamate dehydrogenase (NAD(P)+)
LSVVVQGFGNAGAIAAQLFAEAGAKILAVSDSRGGIFRPAGLDLRSVEEHKQRTGSVVGARGTQLVTNDQLLVLPCDLLIPAALENQIRADNATAIRARLVVEAANGPTTPAADRILSQRGIPVLPDILANSGGVTVSYFEWVQNIENEQWDVEEVNRKLKVKMYRATDDVLDTQRDIAGKLAALEAARRKRERNGQPLSVPDLRTAAYIVAIRRVVSVTLERGIWP